MRALALVLLAGCAASPPKRPRRDTPRSLTMRWLRAQARDDVAALAGFIDPVGGVRAEVEDLVSMKFVGTAMRADAAELLELIGYVDPAEVVLACGPFVGDEGSCVESPDLFPSTYTWRRTPAGTFLVYVHIGDGVE